MTLSPAVRAYLEELRFGVLATLNDDGTAQQTVMWYRLEGDTIVMNTHRGRVKDKNLIRDNRASVCVSDGYRYVTLSGPVTLDDDPVRGQAEIYALAVRYDGHEAADRMMAESFSKQHRVTLLLEFDSVDAHGV